MHFRPFTLLFPNYPPKYFQNRRLTELGAKKTNSWFVDSQCVPHILSFMSLFNGNFSYFPEEFSLSAMLILAYQQNIRSANQGLRKITNSPRFPLVQRYFVNEFSFNSPESDSHLLWFSCCPQWHWTDFELFLCVPEIQVPASKRLITDCVAILRVTITAQLLIVYYGLYR